MSMPNLETSWDAVLSAMKCLAMAAAGGGCEREWRGVKC
jgi:hypothetical protein